MGGFKEKYVAFYDKHHNKLLVATAIFFSIFLLIVVFNYINTGELFERGVSLKGGSVITVQIDKTINIDDVQKSLQTLTSEEITVSEFSSPAGAQLGFMVETTLQNVSLLTERIKSDYGTTNINVETIGPKLGQSFFNHLLISIVIAFGLMALVILIYFRIPAPCAYIVLSAFVDIIFPWAIIILLHVRISSAGVAAFLMLIGYSVDTDILLTSRVLKGKTGTVSERIYGAMSTGLVMTIAAMAATGIAYLTTPSEVLKQITMILFIGLVADMPSTWFQNAGLLKRYMERKERKQERNEHSEKND